MHKFSIRLFLFGSQLNSFFARRFWSKYSGLNRACLIGLAIVFLSWSGIVNSQSTETDQTVDSNSEVQAADEIESAPLYIETRPDKLSTQAVTLELIDEYLELGAHQLAHSVLKTYTHSTNEEDVLETWEKKYYEVAELTENWESIIDRIDDTGNDLPLDLYKFAQTLAIRSEIELKRGSDARKRARRLIWNIPYDSEYVLKWRELIIDSYLADQLYEDAQIALAEFNRDYRPDSPTWEHRYARILLLTGQREAAVARIEGLQTAEGRLLGLYAEYLSKTKFPAEIIDDYIKLLPDLEHNSALTAELWAIVELLARADHHTETQVVAVENNLSIAYEPKSVARIASVVPPRSTIDLINAYENHAIDIGNSYGLIVGDDESWLMQAQEFEILAPVTARAIYSFLSFNASKPETRELAVRSLAAELVRAQHNRIFHLLFVADQSFPLDKVSLADLNRSAQWEISQRDYASAAMIFASMTGPPEDTQREQWLLNRSRVSIYADDFQTASGLLMDLVNSLSVPMDSNLVDRIVQVIFDLQNRDQDLVAIGILNNLFEKSVDRQQKRELLHWLAESYSNQKLHQKSADLFLRSATMAEDWNDDWGRSVSYRSAMELMEAGLFLDSRRIFNSLKELTFDPRLRAVIDERLEELTEREAGSQ